MCVCVCLGCVNTLCLYVSRLPRRTFFLYNQFIFSLLLLLGVVFCLSARTHEFELSPVLIVDVSSIFFFAMPLRLYTARFKPSPKWGYWSGAPPAMGQIVN